jgi:hypothetical protein
MADLTTLYRGQNWFGPSNYLQSLNPGMPGSGNIGGLTKSQLSRLAGQYWTTNPRMADAYGPKIRSMKVPSNYLDKFKRFEKMVTKLPSGTYKHAGVPPTAYLVPKSTIKNVSSGIDLGKTFKHQARNINYPLKGLIDEGKILKAGWDIMGEGYTTGDKLSQLGKNISSEGLAFLKNKAFRTLAMLGSLPAQAGIMTLSPTMMGNAELPQMPQGSPTQISGGNGGGGGYQPTTRAQNVARTASRVGPSGNVKAYGLAHGGLIDLYRYGGFI